MSDLSPDLLFAAPIQSRETDERYTPAWIFDALGETFDLDPASPPLGVSRVPTAAVWTKDDDGLTQPWHGFVWCNPPFSHSTAWHCVASPNDSRTLAYFSPEWRPPSDLPRLRRRRDRRHQPTRRRPRALAADRHRLRRVWGHRRDTRHRHRGELMGGNTCVAEGCGRPVIARGMCTKHYQRWHRANPDAVAPSDRGKPAIERLLSRCVERDGCWVYGGVTDLNGRARIRGDAGAKVFGHRLAFEFFIAPIPEGLTFDHLCENPTCVNPWHGDLVPILVNIRRASRGMAPINRAKTHCPQGHPLSGDNLVVSAPGRICRACRNESNRRYRARKKAAA